MSYRNILGELLIQFQMMQLVTHIRIRLGLKRSVAIVFLIIFFLIALIFLNISAYIAFYNILGPVGAPFTISIINLVFGLSALAISNQFHSSTELREARSLQALANLQLKKELQSESFLYGLLTPETLVLILPIMMKILKTLFDKHSKNKD